MNNFIHKYIFCAGKFYYSNLWVNYSHYSNSFLKFSQGHSLPLALTAALSSLHSSFVRVNRVLRTRRVCVLVNVQFYLNDLVFVLLIMLVNSVYRGLKTSIFHSAKLRKNGYLCNSRFVKVVKRASFSLSGNR